MDTLDSFSFLILQIDIRVRQLLFAQRVLLVWWSAKFATLWMNIVGDLPPHIHGVGHLHLLFPLKRGHHIRILLFDQFIPRGGHCILSIITLKRLDSRISSSGTIDFTHDTFLATEKIVGLLLFLGEFSAGLVDRLDLKWIRIFLRLLGINFLILVKVAHFQLGLLT